MKRFISSILFLAIIFAFVSAANAENSMPSVGLANPLHETDPAELLEKTGFQMTAPDNAEDVRFFYIENAENDLIAEMRFTLEGTEYCYRMKGSAREEDISGMYYSWKNETEAKISYNTAKLLWNDEHEGVIFWYDIVPGVMYSLSVSDRANPADLCSVAYQLFYPLQGDAYGEGEEPVNDPVYGCVIYCTDGEFAIQKLNSKDIYRFAIDNEKTKIYCYSFGTGDYLQITYTGNPEDIASACQIQKLQIVTEDDGQ